MGIVAAGRCGCQREGLGVERAGTPVGSCGAGQPLARAPLDGLGAVQPIAVGRERPADRPVPGGARQRELEAAKTVRGRTEVLDQPRKQLVGQEAPPGRKHDPMVVGDLEQPRLARPPEGIGEGRFGRRLEWDARIQP